MVSGDLKEISPRSSLDGCFFTTTTDQKYIILIYSPRFFNLQLAMITSCSIYNSIINNKIILKGLSHDDFVVLGQSFAKIVT